MNYRILDHKRIFMVEDHSGNRAIMQTLLEQHGATVGFERWGTDTLAYLHKFGTPDVIILDLMFPNGVTGYDIFDVIRTDAHFAAVPIVAVSASEAAHAIPKAKSQGFAGFIPKPFDFDAFPRQIAAIIAGENLWLQD